MKRSSFTILGIVLMCVALAHPHYAFAAANENFESYGFGTLAEALTNPDVTFSGGNLWDITGPGMQLCVVGNYLIDPSSGGSIPLTMDFSSAQGSYSMGYITNGSGDFQVQGYLNSTLVFTDTFVTGNCGLTTPPGGTASGSGTTFDRLVVVAVNPARESGIDNLVTTDAVAVTGLNVPHITQIQINASSPVTPYDSPAGSPVKLANGSWFNLPHDADGNGFDTYIVTDTAVVDGVTWYSIFLGNENFVWVRGDQVQDVGPNPQ